MESGESLPEGWPDGVPDEFVASLEDGGGADWTSGVAAMAGAGALTAGLADCATGVGDEEAGAIGRYSAEGAVAALAMSAVSVCIRGTSPRRTMRGVTKIARSFLTMLWRV